MLYVFVIQSVRERKAVPREFSDSATRTGYISNSVGTRQRWNIADFAGTLPGSAAVHAYAVLAFVFLSPPYHIDRPSYSLQFIPTYAPRVSHYDTTDGQYTRS